LPKEKYGSPSSIHGYFIRWTKAGFFLDLWRAVLGEYDEVEGIAWEWQSIDGSMVKAPMALETVGHNPTDRGKKGSKRHILVDRRGAPLSLVVTGANRHDVSQLEAVLKNRVALPPEDTEQNLCGDKGYRVANVGDISFRIHGRRQKNQRYCSEKVCQLARKAAWQRKKMFSDPDFPSEQKYLRLT
jgi:transposase